jgi:hypothetical protein
MKTTRIIVIILLFSVFSSIVSAVSIDSNTTMTCGHTIYRFKNSQVLSDIYINNSYILFNGSYKYIISSNTSDDIYVNLTGYHHFSVFHPVHSALVEFYISGFTPNKAYNIVVDGDVYTTILANGSGYIYFNYSGWSEHDFVITSSGQYIEVTATRDYSNPLDNMNTVVSIITVAVIITLLGFAIMKIRSI